MEVADDSVQVVTCGDKLAQCAASGAEGMKFLRSQAVYFRGAP